MINKLFAFFFLFTTYCRGQTTEARILHSINTHEIPGWDNSMRVISESVHYAWAIPIVIPIAQGIKTKESKYYRTAIKSTLSIGLASGISGLTKLAVHRTRAFVTYPGYIVQRDHAGPNSFPSGHTTTAFATATSMSLSYPKWYVIVPSYLYAGMVGYSRMRLGMHYPSDVLAGAALGTVVPVLVWKTERWLQTRKKNRIASHHPTD